MGVSIGHAKQKFAAIIEELHQQPPLLSQFAVWLDMKLSEYKLQGGMRLDSHEVVSHPDWMQGIKCRCLLNVSSKLQHLVQESDFGNTAWMFPLLSQGGEDGKHRFQDLFVDDQRIKRNHSGSYEGTTRKRPQCSSDLSEKDSGTFDDLDGGSLIAEQDRSSSGDRNIFSSASSGFYPTPLSKRIKTSQSGSHDPSPSHAASTFLSNLVKASSAEGDSSLEMCSSMTLPVQPANPPLSQKEDVNSVNSPDNEEVVSDCASDVGSDSNDEVDEEDDVLDMMEEDGDQMPKIVSVTSVRPGSSFSVSPLKSSKAKAKWKVHRKMHCPQKKTRVVRNYSREFKLAVVGHSLKMGPKSAMIEFDIAKSNVQRWTTRVVKSCPYTGLVNRPELLENVIKAERDVATWLRDAYTHSGTVSVNHLRENAVPIFRSVYPEFKLEHIWLLHFLAKYKLISCVDIPLDPEDTSQLISSEDGADLY